MGEVTEGFREKFPIYRDVPDRELVKDIAREFPIYLSDPEFSEEFGRFKKGEELRQQQIALEQEPDPTIRGELAEIGKDVGRQMLQVSANMLASGLESIGQTAAAAERRFPAPFGPSDPEDFATIRLSNAIRKASEDLAKDIDPEIADSFALGKFPRAVSSGASFLAGGGALRLAKVPATLGIASLGASVSGGEGFRRAKFAGADDETAFKSLLANAGVGTSEAIPLAGMLNRINRATGNKLGRALLEGVEEIGQETFQSLAENKIAQTLTDEDVELIEGVVEDGAAGGLSGFFLSLLISSVPGRQRGVDPNQLVDQTGGQTAQSLQNQKNKFQDPLEQSNFELGEIEKAAERQRQRFTNIAEAEARQFEQIERRAERQREEFSQRSPGFTPAGNRTKRRAGKLSPKTVENLVNKAPGKEPFSLPKILQKPTEVGTQEPPSAVEPEESFVTSKNIPWTSVLPRQIQVQATQDTVDAAREFLERQQQSQQSASPGTMFQNVGEIPGFLQAVQAQSQVATEPTEAAQAQQTQQSLEQVEATVRKQISQRDFKGAIQNLGNLKLSDARGIIERAIGPDQDVVLPQEIGDKIVLNTMWDKAVALSQQTAPVADSVEDAVRQTSLLPTAEEQQEPAQQPQQTEEGQEQPAQEPETPEDQRLGIVPPGSQALQRFLHRYTPESAIPFEAPVIDTTKIAPDLQPYEKSVNISTKPNGLSRIPLVGWMFDPRGKHNTRTEKGIITRANEVIVGKALASTLSLQLKGKIDGAFTFEGSEITNVEGRDDTPRHISDFMEQIQRDPSVYDLTPDQQEAVDTALFVLREIQDLQKRNGVNPGQTEDEFDRENLDPEVYFPRQRLFTKEERDQFGLDSGPVTQSVGGRQGYAKTRLFKSEALGVKNEVTYFPSIEDRLTTLLAQSYRAIADKRFADNLEIGEKLSDRKARILAQFEQDIEEGEISRENVLDIVRTLRPDETTIDAPAFQGLIFNKKEAQPLKKVFERPTNEYLRKLSTVNSAAKAMAFGIDFAAPFLQGQTLIFTDPKLWAKATKNHFKAFVKADVMQKYIQNRENLTAMRELAQLGVPLGTLQDIMVGLKRGQPLQDLLVKLGKPGEVGANTLERFARSFQTFNEMAMIEMWKAQRTVTPKDQWAQAAESIQNQLMRGRMEEIGLSPGRALIERAILLAPAFQRGSVNLISNLGAGGVSGTQARKAIGRWMFGGSLAFIGTALALGVDWDEILERLNPAASDFGMVPIKFPDGRTRNFGLGGPLRSLMRLNGQIISSIVKGDGKVTSLGMNNPILRWFRGKLAPAPGLISDAWLGVDFLGNEISPLEALAARVTPLAAQEIIRRPGEPPATMGEIGSQVLGMQVWPESIGKSMARERDKLAQEAGFEGYEFAPLGEQMRISRELQERPEFQKPPASPQQILGAMKAKVRRRERIRESLSQRNRKMLDDLEVNIIGYDPTISFGRGQSMPLTANQSEKYEELLIQEYDRQLSALDPEVLKDLEPTTKQEIINESLGLGKETARAFLIRDMVERSETSLQE